ncbi:MAG: S8 family serine peptidase [Candidatus Heimdallarchaeota archaeon]|nr:S8 family serine peptidase [Candidatus Heimdallarchaeota archaeon]
MNSRLFMAVMGLVLLSTAGVIVSQEPTVQVLVNYDGFDNIVLDTLESMGINIERSFSLIPTVVVNVPTSMVRSIEKLPGVLSVQYNEQYTIEAIPNDASYSQLWGMDKIQAPEAWDIRTDASSVVVAVIDTGVQLSHPDLTANKWVNPGEIAGNGIDDDNNGFVDDINGWDFANNDASYYDGTSDDHGTHVAGTIGGVGNNGMGVAGVSWNVKLMALKFLSSTGGSTADAISAIEYATMMGADIISASWGGGGFDQALKDAIDAFPGLFVAAAGNDGTNNDATAHYPSSYTSSNLIAVASTDSADGMSSFSNYGATSVDIAAPGSSIYSTWPSNTYNTISGTSMATPHVSGAAALVLANEPSLSPEQLKAKLMDNADLISSQSGRTVSEGRLNVYRALTGAAPPPPPPTTTETFTGSVSSSSPNVVHYFNVDNTGDISATLSWGTSADVDMYLYSPTQDTSSSSVYMARAYTTSNPENLAAATSAIGTHAIRVNLYSGVTTSYTLEVTYPGTSTGGDTEAPSQVTGLSAGATSNSQIALSWSSASDNVGVTGYNIYRNGGFLTSTTGTSYTDSGLTGSTTYSYQVSAYDAAGNEGTKSSTASATTSADPDTTAPSQVTGLTATSAGLDQINLAWNAASDNIGVTGYRIYRGGSFLTSVTGTSYADTGLTEGTTYTYTVAAYDAAGNLGSQSSSASATTDSSTPPTGPITETFTGTVSSSSKNAIFYFDVGEAGDIDVVLSWSTSADLDFYLYAPGTDPSGSSYVVRAYTLSNPETVSYAATQTGTWAVRVNYYSGVTSSFSLEVTHPGTGGTTPPTTGTVTDTFTGSVSSSARDDIFYFDVAATGSIDIVLSWSTSADLDFYLYAPGADPTSSSGYAVRAYTTRNPETVSYTATQTGTWAVRVNYYSGVTSSYTLEVSYQGLIGSSFSMDSVDVSFAIDPVFEKPVNNFILNLI